MLQRFALLTAAPVLLLLISSPVRADAPGHSHIEVALTLRRWTEVPARWQMDGAMTHRTRVKVPAPPLPHRAPKGSITPARLMSQVVTMTNQQRHAYGCDQLAVDQELTIASIRQSLYMARTGLFSHTWRDGTTFVARSHAAGYAQPSGENIAWGYHTAAEVMDAWMASPSHRENILNCGARSIGTGVAYGPNGLPYYTQVFGWE